MKKLATILFILLAVAFAYGQTRVFEPTWQLNKSAELEGGEHTPILYTGTESLVGADVTTNWMLLGWVDGAPTADNFRLLHFTPAQWSITVGLERYGAGDSVGVGSCYWELAFDTTAAPIWMADSANIFYAGAAGDTGSVAETRAVSIPLGIHYPAYGRLVFGATTQEDTTTVNYTLIGTSKPNGSYEAYRANQKSDSLTATIAGILHVYVDSIGTVTVAVDVLPAITGTVDVGTVTTLPAITGTVDVNNLSETTRDSAVTASLTELDTIVVSSTALGNVKGFYRLEFSPDSTCDSIAVQYRFVNGTFGHGRWLPCYADTNRTDGNAVTYVSTTAINEYVAGVVYPAILYDPTNTLPMPVIPTADDKLEFRFIQLGDAVQETIITYWIIRQEN